MSQFQSLFTIFISIVALSNFLCCIDAQQTVPMCTNVYFGYSTVPQREFEANRGICAIGSFLSTSDMKCYPMTDAVQRKKFKECTEKIDCSLGVGFGSDLMECIQGSCSLPKRVGDQCTANEQCITQLCRHERCDYAKQGESCSTEETRSQHRTSCAIGLRCNGNGKCVRLSNKKETCTTDSDCVDGLYCDSAKGDPICLSPLRPDEQCRPGSAPCDGAFFCKKDPAQSLSSDIFFCKPKRVLHEYCEDNDWCASSQKNPVWCRNNRCEPQISFSDLDEGSPCLHNRDCKEGITCANGICTRAERAQCYQDSQCHTGHDIQNECLCTPALIEGPDHTYNGTCSYNCDRALSEYNLCTMRVYAEDNIAWGAPYYGAFHPRCCGKFAALVNCKSRWMNSFYPGSVVPRILDCPAPFNTRALVGVLAGVFGGSALVCACCIVIVVVLLIVCISGVGLLCKGSTKRKKARGDAQWLQAPEEQRGDEQANAAAQDNANEETNLLSA
uniref:Uncharacterized protein n=1 Tax=Percolomonas cosmopolitus TaxID=63605 RepID=A0A7S1PID3_9EUKA